MQIAAVFGPAMKRAVKPFPLGQTTAPAAGRQNSVRNPWKKALFPPPPVVWYQREVKDGGRESFLRYKNWSFSAC